MEAQWTYYLDEKANRFGIRDERHEHIATIEGGGYQGKGTFENRARLIAAAPRMLVALKDLLGDMPSVQGGICQHCGRDYSGEILSGDCPSDDCPSFKAKVAIAFAGMAA